MVKLYFILKKILPDWLYVYLQNYKRLVTLPQDIRTIVKSLNSKDICLDFGANVGIYSQLFAKYQSKVYSFEPDPIPFRLLKEKSLKFKNIYPFMKAVGTSNSKGKLYLDKNYSLNELFYSEHNSLVKEKDNVSETYIEVEIIDIAEWLKDFDNIKFAKIDVEGFEVELINYLIDSAAIDKIDYIFVETHEKRIKNLNSEIKELKFKINHLGIENKFFWNWP
ncbi:FkbM family methyltransferase [Acidimicrobiia bacterium]|nr:FkbM family methyltransferase [Acidimicrobiia bacterium]|tara:strand:- start:1162 stop:1827 length:666 start_codon:yes stop_codon:yes gene_type:complete